MKAMFSSYVCSLSSVKWIFFSFRFFWYWSVILKHYHPQRFGVSTYKFDTFVAFLPFYALWGTIIWKKAWRDGGGGSFSASPSTVTKCCQRSSTLYCQVEYLWLEQASLINQKGISGFKYNEKPYLVLITVNEPGTNLDLGSEFVGQPTFGLQLKNRSL